MERRSGGRSRAITAGDERAGVRVEFVRSRGVVRLGGWHERDHIPKVDVPVARFVNELGLEPAELWLPLQYLLVASARPTGARSFRRLVSMFGREEEARHAFQQLRLGETVEWAEVNAFDARGNPRRVCWVGVPADVQPRTTLDGLRAGGAPGNSDAVTVHVCDAVGALI